jgi:hypothetical protein
VDSLGFRHLAVRDEPGHGGVQLPKYRTRAKAGGYSAASGDQHLFNLNGPITIGRPTCPNLSGASIGSLVNVAKIASPNETSNDSATETSKGASSLNWRMHLRMKSDSYLPPAPFLAKLGIVDG